MAGEIRDAGFEVLTSEARQALGFHRVLLHHAMGAPRLGRLRPIAWALDALENAAKRALPRAAWLYHAVVARRAD